MDEKNSVKQTIILKAVELFSGKGYEGVSVGEITEASKITKPTLYYYFGSKEGLFEAVCQLYYTELNSLLKGNVVYFPNPKSYNEDVYLTLTKTAAAYFSFARSNEAFFRIVLANLSMPSSSEIYKIVEKYHFTQFDIVDNMFKSMAKEHGNLKGKSKTLTWSFIGIINSYISLSFNGVSALHLNEKTAKELVHQFMHGIYA